MKGKTLVIRLAALAVVAAIAATMLVIGRGHTIYFDNKTLENGSETYKAYHKVEVFVKGESVGKLLPRERISSIWLGQNFHMDLLITDDDGQEQMLGVDLKLPYSIDGIIINLPALLNGASEEVWMDEFIPAPETETDDEPDIDIGDAFTGGTEVFE